ncbi:hypothetical protein [uncultured Tateyamaria sp.]|uniref:hypothetical protein n=1 Tax=uncultured Tateyamaria sp. TaxID=455651 RepID=UPI0026289383|nr:hypothetical protein [uncultured Tateyamaria sp.]
MTLKLHRPFIATIAALAIVITGFSAAPARAQDDQVAAAIAALLGLAVVGAIIKDRKDDREDRHRKETKRKKVHKAPQHIQRHKHNPRPIPNRVSRKLLPQHCLRSFDTHRGQARVFGQRCLENNYRHVHSLPAQCHREFRTNRGWRQGYAARCLNRHGYQLARR